MRKRQTHATMKNESLERGPKRRSGPEYIFWRLLKTALQKAIESIDVEAPALVTAVPHRRSFCQLPSCLATAHQHQHQSHVCYTFLIIVELEWLAKCVRQPFWRGERRKNRIEMFSFRLRLPLSSDDTSRWPRIYILYSM